MPASLAHWGPLFGALALDVLLLVALAFAMQRFVRAAAWRRTLWQVALLGMAATIGVEITGARRLMAPVRLAPTQANSSADLAFQTSTNAAPNLASVVATLRSKTRLPVADTLSTASESNRPVRPHYWWPGALWLLGFASIGLWMAASRLAFTFFVRRTPVHDATLVARTQVLAGRLGLARRVKVTEIRGLAGPIAFGLFRPTIGLPEGFTRAPARYQDAMLAHELAHLAARDPLWHAFADGLAALLWWHPLVWLARRELRAASEVAADEASLLVEAGPTALAECLVELGQRLTRPRSLAWLGMEGSGFRSGLGRRVERLVSLPDQPWAPMRKRAHRLAKTFGCLALLTVVLAATAWLQPREARADSFQHAFRESALGLVLAAAMPALQAEPASSPTPAVAPDSHELHTRWFRIDPTAAFFVAALGDWLGTNALSSENNRTASAVLADLRQILTLAGLELAPPKHLIFNSGGGQLMIRAASQDFEVIEQILGMLNSAPSQVRLEVRYLEASEETIRALGFDWFLGGARSNAIPKTEASTVILTDPQCRVVLRALEQRAGVNLTALPSVTAPSGRHAQIKLATSRSVANALASGTDISSESPVVDLLPVIQNEGPTISLTTKASRSELAGYDIGRRTVTMPDGRKEIVNSSEPFPIFQKHEWTTDAILFSGQTLVMTEGSDGLSRNPQNHFPPLGSLPVIGHLFRETSKTRTLIFVTPTIVNNPLQK